MPVFSVLKTLFNLNVDQALKLTRFKLVDIFLNGEVHIYINVDGGQTIECIIDSL